MPQWVRTFVVERGGWVVIMLYVIGFSLYSRLKSQLESTCFFSAAHLTHFNVVCFQALYYSFMHNSLFFMVFALYTMY